MLIELRVAETGVDDGPDAPCGIGGARQPLHGIGAQLCQKVAHGGEEQLVVVLEIVMYHAGGDPRLGSNARHGGIGEAVLMDGDNRRLHQLPSPDLRHSELRHPDPFRSELSFFIGQLSNENLPSA